MPHATMAIRFYSRSCDAVEDFGNRSGATDVDDHTAGSRPADEGNHHDHRVRSTGTGASGGTYRSRRGCGAASLPALRRRCSLQRRPVPATGSAATSTARVDDLADGRHRRRGCRRRRSEVDTRPPRHRSSRSPPSRWSTSPATTRSSRPTATLLPAGSGRRARWATRRSGPNRWSCCSNESPTVASRWARSSASCGSSTAKANGVRASGSRRHGASSRGSCGCR